MVWTVALGEQEGRCPLAHAGGRGAGCGARDGGLGAVAMRVELAGCGDKPAPCSEEAAVTGPTRRWVALGADSLWKHVACLSLRLTHWDGGRATGPSALSPCTWSGAGTAAGCWPALDAGGPSPPEGEAGLGVGHLRSLCPAQALRWRRRWHRFPLSWQISLFILESCLKTLPP